MMGAFDTVLKVVVLIALVTVVPVWLAVQTGYVLASVGGSVLLAIVLVVVWMRGKAR